MLDDKNFDVLQITLQSRATNSLNIQLWWFLLYILPQQRNLLFVKRAQRLHVLAELLHADPQLLRRRMRLPPHAGTQARTAWRNEAVREEQKPVGAPEHLHERNAVAVHVLRVTKRRAAVLVHDVDDVRVRLGRLTVEHETHATQKCALKVVPLAAGDAFGHTRGEVRDVWRG